MDTGGTNYLKPFLRDIGKLGQAWIDVIKGGKTVPTPEPDSGMQLMGPPTDLQKKSTEGSPAFSKAELKQGYRKIGKGK